MKPSFASFKVLFLVVFSLVIFGCEQESLFDGARVDKEGFTEKVANANYCYSYAAYLSQNPKNKVTQGVVMNHYSSMMRMQAEKFCKPNHVDYYTCFATRSYFKTSDHCEKPSPLPSAEEITQCADDVALSMGHAKPLVEEKTSSTKGTVQEYFEVCSTITHGELGLPSFN